MLAEFIRLAKNANGVIEMGTYALESSVIEGCNQFAKIYPVGLALAPSWWDKSLTLKNPTLNSCLGKHDKKSVLYISFGYVFSHLKRTASMLKLILGRYSSLPWNRPKSSLAQGIPIILWPLAQCDQAINAALLSTRKNPVAF